MAHLGMLQCLKEYRVEADLIAGVSGGAMVGAFYAAGYSPLETLDFFLETKLFALGNFSFSKMGIIDTLRMEGPMAAFFPENRFEALKKHLVVVTTDLNAPKMVAFEKGELLRPLLASSAFPGMFTPVEIDGVLYADGGITNNFPADLIRDKCDILLGMHLRPVKSRSTETMGNVAELLDRVYDIYSASKVAKRLALCDGLMIPDGVGDYGTFSVKNEDMERIFEIGYESTSKFFREEKGHDLMTRIKELV
ncbi:hypothetical protein FUAX_25430 [Fulvitalea axinellae]|uniref:PNPLA domain-containing protein n=2 Tax=Fulvitalea axinellae TaxID=1182444 RepID=A0AAU9CM65_9BACT|nr:hypothetical protein FUAX_25430 [Fulvitalea axinellae]